MSETLETLIASSSRRLAYYLSNPDAPPPVVVDHEFHLLVKRIGSLVGPERIRGWMDELTDATVAGLSSPGRTLT